MPIVARAPDVLEVGPILNGAVQVRAGGREGAKIARRRAHDDSRSGAEEMGSGYFRRIDVLERMVGPEDGYLREGQAGSVRGVFGKCSEK